MDLIFWEVFPFVYGGIGGLVLLGALRIWAETPFVGSLSRAIPGLFLAAVLWPGTVVGVFLGAGVFWWKDRQREKAAAARRLEDAKWRREDITWPEALGISAEEWGAMSREERREAIAAEARRHPPTK